MLLTTIFFSLKAFGGDDDDYIEGNDGRDIIMGDFGFYDTWSFSGNPKLLVSINCTYGGEDALYGGDGDVDYIVGGRSDDTIYGDDTSSTNNENLDLVFGDHAQIMFYEEQSHKLAHAVTTNAGCNGGNDDIWLGPGDDLVSLSMFCDVV